MASVEGQTEALGALTEAGWDGLVIWYLSKPLTLAAYHTEPN